MKTKPTKTLKLFSGAFNISVQEVKHLCNLAFKEGQSSPKIKPLKKEPKIKQLEWKEYENLRGRKSYFAKTPFSTYDVADGGDHYTMFSPDKRLRFALAKEAKAAAQADFEKRIKECLE